jgi:hypothetical protein
MVSPFLTSALDGAKWSASSPCRFTPYGKSFRNTLDRRLGGPKIWPRRCGVEIDLSPVLRIEPWPFSQQPVTIPAELSQINNFYYIPENILENS